MTARATQFAYSGLTLSVSSAVGQFHLDGREFTERVDFSGVGPMNAPAPRAVLELWYLLAGLSYYKAGAALRIDLGETPVSPAGRELLRAAILDGLGEYAYRNALDLADVEIDGGRAATSVETSLEPERVLTPFGGGIDSVVAVSELSSDLDQSLFVVSPRSGPFEPLEATAAVTGRTVVRATRELDPAIVAGDPSFFSGHVPVTAMITLLAAAAAVADGRGGVVMSNEHSASVPNFVVNGREINHQWSKSWVAEQLISRALVERLGDTLCVASVLRSRSELWVAERFSRLREYHSTFRSCNRAFRQTRAERAITWCGECDKCLFIHLVLAPFMDRAELAGVLGVEPLADPARRTQLRTLVGLGEHRKPFECVGDPSECAVALRAVSELPAWRDVDNVNALVGLLDRDETLEEMLEPRGVSRVPSTWLR